LLKQYKVTFSIGEATLTVKRKAQGITNGECDVIAFNNAKAEALKIYEDQAPITVTVKNVTEIDQQ
jgi:hypothetical protein